MHRILASTIGALLALTSCMRQQPEERVHKLLTDRIQTLATAESCTGGTIAARFTAMPGASAYFKCGVTYSLDAKQNFVNICCDTIARYGAVSEQVVRQMAEGVRHLANAHYAIATTGIAGPTGGTPEYPVGSVWIAVSSPLRTTADPCQRRPHANHPRSGNGRHRTARRRVARRPTGQIVSNYG
jgi:nicotinamide-nucleotide amidase